MEYRLNAGQFVLHAKRPFSHELEPVGRVLDEIALAIDTVDGILHKHGPAEKVSAWHAKTTQALRAAGADEMADHLVVVTGRFPLEEVNRCLSITTYAGHFYQKLLAGQVEQLGWGAADEPDAPPAPTSRG